MANNFVPFDLKIKNILGDTAIISWDVHNAIEFKPGTKYNIYVSADDLSYNLLKTAVRTETTVALSAANKFIKISSLHASFGESALSQALGIATPETLAEYKEITPIATDELGKSRALKINSLTGRLEVDAFLSSAIIAEINTVGLSTEAKQDATLINLADLNAKQDAALLYQQTQIDLLTEIKLSVAADNLISTEAVAEPVSVAGTKITLPFAKKAKILQVTLLHEFGTATAFSVNIWRKKISSSDRDILARFDSYDLTGRLDVIKAIPYISLDNADEITLQILPNNGTSNRFFVRVAGSLA